MHVYHNETKKLNRNLAQHLEYRLTALYFSQKAACVMSFSLPLVLGPVQDHTLHPTTGIGTTQECTRTEISEGITEDIGGLIISVDEIEGSIHGASITEVVMEIIGPIGKTTAKPIALVGAALVLGHPRDDLHPQGLEAILEILTNLHLIDQGGLRHLGPPLIIAEQSPPSAGR